MTTLELLSALRSRDIRLWVEGDQLRFGAPKGALTPELRAEIAARKAEIIAFLQQASSDGPSIQPIMRDGPPPLSFAQQRLWFLDQLSPGVSGYNIPTAIHLSGRLDLDALQHSLDALISRHETLRTTFTTIDGEPVQMIAPALPLPLLVEDLRHLPPAARDAAVQRHLAQEDQQPFDLARGPLLRARLLQLAADEYVAVFTLHHIITDLWSMGILIQELAALYVAEVTSTPVRLPALPIQYADFAVWQRGWLQEQDEHGSSPLQRQLSYWQQQLGSDSGDLPVLDLPLDRPRPNVQTFPGASETIQLSRGLTAALHELSQREGATLFMTLLAAFQLLLARHSGQDDIVVGSPIAGRTRTEIEGLIGFFVNTLVLRGDLAGNPSFRELLQRVRTMTLAAYAHQDVPFEMLVEKLRPRRDLSRTPLFQAVFALQNAPVRSIELPGLTLRPIEIRTNTAPFELTLQITELDGELHALIDYNTDLFDAATITRLLEHYQTLLEGIAADPDQRIAQLPLLSAAERQQQLVTWNNSGAPTSADQCAHELFEAQAARTPDAIAVVCADQRLTYGELDERANRLAAYLREHGVGPETLVALCLDRSPELIVAMVAVLKASGAYVPLDPSYPVERLQFMLQDSRAAVLLTQQRLLTRLPTTVPSVCLDHDWPIIARYSSQPLPNVATSTNLAYVIYTSGSTGRPKGVMIEHRNLFHLIGWHRRVLGGWRDDRAPQLAGLGFDAAVWEIWPYLSGGACLYLVDDETRLSPTELRDWLIAQAITICFVPTPLAQRMMTLPWPDTPSLRTMLTGGDRLEHAPPPTLPYILFNNYGPTETTVVATMGEVVPTADDAQPPTIGRPIDNVRCYVLDPAGALVPAGTPGELYIAGAGLGRGYLGRPALTAECFVPNPFAAGERLYRTGDRVRYRPDGEIEFLGRIDDQVKLRGFRIELGEIEATLLQHPAVHEAVVVTRPDADGAARLVAYVVGEQRTENQRTGRPLGEQKSKGTKEQGSSLQPSALRQFLATRLPEYMVPSAFVMLETWPLTPNGKIDRRALPEPKDMPGAEEQRYVAPRTPIEQTVATLAAQVLHIERIGVHDNFFDRGGHSLLATRLITQLREIFTIDLPLRSLFETPTVAGLAEHIEALQWVAQTPVLSSSTDEDRQEGEL